MLVPFSIGIHKIRVLCNVIPMTVAQLLLGQLWLFDRNMTHDAEQTTYTFPYNGKKVIFQLKKFDAQRNTPETS